MLDLRMQHDEGNGRILWGLSSGGLSFGFLDNTEKVSVAAKGI